MTYFHKARIVANHFHWVRYACNALDEIRIDVQFNLPKFERKYFKHWTYEIKDFLEVPYSNKSIEETNNKIKVLKRTSFGMSNLKKL